MRLATVACGAAVLAVAAPAGAVDTTIAELASSGLVASPGPTAAGTPSRARHAASETTEVVTVDVPVVAFASHVAAVNGRVRTPVLLLEPGITAAVGLTGTACTRQLATSVITWVDCPVGRLPNPEISVTTSDGRVYRASVDVSTSH